APWEPPLDQDGHPDPAVAASAASAGMRQVVAAAWQAIALHYRGEPAVVGYTCWNPFFDWTWHDSPEHRYDHCASARSAWAAFAGGQPAPAWAAEGPDLSSAWRRWAAFRDHLAGLWHLDGFARAVRAVDPHRRLWVYEAAGGHGATETRWDEYRRLGVQPAHGGGEPRDMVSHFQLAAAHGLGWRHESVAAPARHPIANDLLVFHALFGGLDQAWNTAWNCNWTNTHAQPGIASARQRLRQLATVVDALLAEGYVPAPASWTQFLGWDGAALNRRTFQWHGLEADLLLGHMSDSLSGTAISDHTPLALWPHGGLVVGNHFSVITPESAASLRRHAEQGGTVALHLGPGPGLAAVAEAFGFSVSGPATAARVAGQGLPPLFPADRRVVVLKPLPVQPPADARPCLVAADGSPLAWRLARGTGAVVVTAGAVDALASRGWLEDLARTTGDRRRFQLTAGAGDDHPPEGLLFTRADGGAVLALHRAILWNLHGRMIDQASAAPPTIAGFASIHQPKPVTVRWWAPQAGTWQVERWQDGAWVPLGPATTDTLAGEGLTVAMTAGECVFVRFLPAAH
ncbi:MAG: hypothetical protein L6R48_15455, partial [Planctomycetes bacterium]|nr:hypothetical protein [Planctomycetota bacterium]